MRIEDPRDSNKRYFRATDRLISLNGAWFYTTREGDVGPYPSKEVAAQELARFTQEMVELASFKPGEKLETKNPSVDLARSSAPRQREPQRAAKAVVREVMV